MERICDTLGDGGDKRREDNREEDKRQEEESVAPESDEEDEDKECYPGDPGIGEEEGHEDEDEVQARQEAGAVLPRIDDSIHTRDRGDGEEVETEDIRVTEGTEDAGGRDTLIRKADAEEELSESEEDRQHTRNENRHEEEAKVTVAFDAGVGHEADDEEIEDTQYLLARHDQVDRVGEGTEAPDDEEAVGEEQGVVAEATPPEKDEDETEESNAETEKL